MLKKIKQSIEGKTISVSGFGNVDFFLTQRGRYWSSASIADVGIHNMFDCVWLRLAVVLSS